ncbi:aspartate-semialdehyde dehydrogenase [Pseudomonas cavernicola]|uniref:Aspartate-semialdehyde dehydrogenase n=1 Tax=Pseudomonas cavernicola TaxID=2320866 RepID=A0A418XMY5_9PSED|nr:aspartate-semialdehyde dehydrogenase [Pseudomonas cavernicola]RJG13796.1 aspartate-semialdehyde dehydrogenase [Pseudomonas cavernicola]
MSQPFDIAVIGATGTVGETLVQILEERDFPVGTLHLLASIESAGQSVPFRGKNVRVREVDEFDFSKVRLVFFAAGEQVTLAYAPRAHAAGCALIDLSGALPAEQAPRVVPEANAELLKSLSAPYQLSSPSASVTALAVVLAPLHGLLTLQRLSVTACLAVSSQGREGVVELARQTAELLNVRPLEPRFFDRQIAFNLLGQVGPADDAGHTLLEKRLADELKQILADPALKVAATCVQAPVFFGDSLSLSLQSATKVDLKAVCAALDSAPGIERVEPGDYPTAVGDAVGQDVVYVGRVRNGLDDPTELNLWIASDNVRKGAALNAVQIGELLIKHYL